MFEVRRTAGFDKWLLGLEDRQAAQLINARLYRITQGFLGDYKMIGRVLEMRVFAGPGYRLYCVRSGATVIVMLGGGTKKTKTRDIERARQMAESLE